LNRNTHIDARLTGDATKTGAIGFFTKDSFVNLKCFCSKFRL